eukprot:5959784-Alexandrium_andersonii.AAC.1
MVMMAMALVMLMTTTMVTMMTAAMVTMAAVTVVMVHMTQWHCGETVSYTHLTLPTICSV